MVKDPKDPDAADAGRVSLDESIARAMDGSDGRIVPFLPYIFQDAWELGAIPGMVIDIVRRHARDLSALRVLDLGCGKGAVSVGLAAALGCRCLGIDGVPEFIDFAGAKAAATGVGHLCRFEVADIRTKITALGRFDVIVLGAIGPVFGDYSATLGTLAPHLAEGGIAVVDDGYLPDDSPRTHPQVLKRGDLLRQIAAAGMRIVEEAPVTGEELERLDGTLFQALERRCGELMEKYPEQKALFEDYVRRQVEESEFLKSEVICVVLALGRPDPPAASRGSV